MLSAMELLVAAALVTALHVMSVLDFALAGISKIALRRLVDATETRRSPLIGTLVEERNEVLMAVHIGIQALLISIAVLLTGAFLRTALHFAVALLAAAGTTLVIVLVFRQLVPRALALRNPEQVLARLVPVLTVPYYILRPLVRLIMAVLTRFLRWEEESEPEPDEEASEEEIQAFIDAGQEEGILEQDEGVMIQSIVQFGDKVALEVMTPRTQIVAADVAWSVDRLVGLIVSKKHSRIPVYRDELDNIEGIVHERDLLRVWRGGEQLDNIRPLVHPVHFVPETKPIDDLLEEMKTHRRQIVLVVDEYGGISGLITIEDLIEEIVGEIRDDSEPEGDEILEESPGIYLVPATVELDVMESRLGMPVVDDTECTTVGGAAVELFGFLPSRGEKIEHQGLSFEVVEADRRKIRRLRIRLLSPQRK